MGDAQSEHRGRRTDDQTIRRCTGFTKSWGLGGLVVVNLYAMVATDPAALRTALYVRPRHEVTGGPMNDDAIHDAAVGSRLVVVAWGAHAERARADAVLGLLALLPGERVRCLGLTRGGQPRHPLRLAATTPLDLVPGRGDPATCSCRAAGADPCTPGLRCMHARQHCEAGL